jgi:hypothetical protein
VTFAITKYGRARDIEIRGVANAAAADQGALESLLKGSRFRPRPSDGAGEQAVAVRYYIYD